mmetsp:Transcript_11944/g.23199  ORF Transcript_11944/g.23199 Transcript_11944/m.23199 type:complete len:223 (-) Transcript_11944:496-1164(-)
MACITSIAKSFVIRDNDVNRDHSSKAALCLAKKNSGTEGPSEAAKAAERFESSRFDNNGDIALFAKRRASTRMMATPRKTFKTSGIAVMKTNSARGAFATMVMLMSSDMDAKVTKMSMYFGNMMSIDPRSDPSRDKILPLGVASKYDIGACSNTDMQSACRLSPARAPNRAIPLTVATMPITCSSPRPANTQIYRPRPPSAPSSPAASAHTDIHQSRRPRET